MAVELANHALDARDLGGPAEQDMSGQDPDVVLTHTTASDIRVTKVNGENPNLAHESLNVPDGGSAIVPVTDMTNEDEKSSAKEDVKSSIKKDKSGKSARTKKKAFVKLNHYRGKSFLFPWAHCQTWDGIETLIKLSYENDEEAKQEFDAGKYQLFTKDGATIFRQHWEMLVEPKWEFTCRLESQPVITSDTESDTESEDNSNSKKDDSEEEEEDFETVYKTEVNYTIAYYKKARWSDDDPEFLHSRSYSSPVLLQRRDWKDRERPILEEKKIVIVPRESVDRYEDQNRERGRKLESEDVVGKTSLRIHSPFLLNALRSIIKYSSHVPSGDSTDQSSYGEFPYPYADLFNHKQELFDYKSATTGPRLNHTAEYNEECDRHIDFLLEYLDQESGVQIKSVEVNWAKKIPTTTFSGLWLLMKPGSDVYIEENGIWNAYIVDAISHGVDYSYQKRGYNATSYSITIWNLRYDGKVIRRRSKVVDVPVFDGERDIMSLPLIPSRFQDKLDNNTRREKLIERGKKVFQYSKGPAFLEYTGFGLKHGWKKYNRARVVVEHESLPWEREEFETLHAWHMGEEKNRWRDDDEEKIGDRARSPRCECSKCADMNEQKEKYIAATFSDYDNIKPKEYLQLSDHQCMLLMSHMYAFVLKDRTYDLLDVGNLSDVGFAEDAIDTLVMRPESNKDTIKAIVQTYGDSNQGELFSADYISGKGEGQIFLLHGPPGTGKTLTAESVAEYTKRPLLNITAADLGHKPVDLEKNLLGFFKDASHWDAIVLLDEADVYLERRSSSDLRRNSIVSIFLRAMDYFQGILFLTTNRVGHFDEAFMSRIHVSIGYSRLDDKAREQIWDNLFRKLKDDHKKGGPEIRYDYDAKQYVKKNEELKQLQWNGREIRNAFQTAVALAVYDSKSGKGDSIPEINEKHLSQVVSMSAAFKDYITATHEGIEEPDMAYKLGNRYDG